MIAEYIAVDNETLQQLRQLAPNQLANQIVELIESDQYPHVDLGKLWDVLHFTLTNQSATQPVADQPLSEAIVGLDTFSENEDDDFIAINEWHMIAEIVDALEQVNFDQKLSQLQLKALREADIFPKGIWQDKKANLSKELKTSFMELKAFYESALDNGNNVIVSIL